jgi:hypothetical protein
MDRYRRIATRANSWPDRLIKYLMHAEERDETPDEREIYRFCRRLVSLALDGWSDPYVAAFYYHYGRHPNKLIPEFLWRAEQNRRLNIPDYDPLSDPLCKVRSFPSRPGPMYQMPVSSWPDQQDTLRSPQEEEFAGQPQISHTGAEDFARPNAFLEASAQSKREHRKRRLAMNMCERCRNPVCEESRCLCALHLQRQREDHNAWYARKRRAMGKTVQHANQPAALALYWQARRARDATESVISGGFSGS